MDVSIVIPIHNERDNLPDLLEDIRRESARWTFSFEIVAVDDGSTDDSRACLEGEAQGDPRLRVVALERGGGMGRALMAGCATARSDVMVWMMGDRSDRVEDVPLLVEALSRGADLVVASRAMPGGSYGQLGRLKAGLSHLYSAVTRRVFGIPAHDITNAYRAVRRETLDRAKPRCADFAISPELAIRARRIGARITEIPTVYRYRERGDSHFKMWRMGWRYAGLYRLLFTRGGDPGDAA